MTTTELTAPIRLTLEPNKYAKPGGRDQMVFRCYDGSADVWTRHFFDRIPAGHDRSEAEAALAKMNQRRQAKGLRLFVLA